MMEVGEREGCGDEEDQPAETRRSSLWQWFDRRRRFEGGGMKRERKWDRESVEKRGTIVLVKRPGWSWTHRRRHTHTHTHT